ncbi:MAG: DHA2 family efflux MFS transporter permease subunit [Solirubrobacteraceae bacterium]
MATTRGMWLTLVAMTLASSMILVDQTSVPLASPDVVQGLGGSVNDGQWVLTANILPLAAFMVLGGRLGDLFGLRRVFLTGAVLFAVATALASAAQSIVWVICMRAAQGSAAALMMPTAVAITSAVWPRERRGYALGILAGGSSFFAALGPVLGGVLTSVSWRLVFLINVPLALAAIALTLAGTPDLPPDAENRRRLDWTGTGVFAVAIVALIFGLSRGQPDGWDSASAVIPLAICIVAFWVFGMVERRVANPLIDFRLFRRLNFLASVISQVIAGAIELGLGYLLPFYLLIVVGVGPVTAGVALIPGTLPIILAGPLAGRMFDRLGGRVPLVAGFIVLALSGVALAVAATGDSAVALIPGLLLQGAGLGIVLTINDPVGMNAVDDADSGQAAGIINTAEQMGGAIGIAGLGAAQLGFYFHVLYSRLAARGINPTPAQTRTVKHFIDQAEIKGLHNVPLDPDVRAVLGDLIHTHAQSFQFAFYISAGIALVGAVTSWGLVRKQAHTLDHPIFGRRSRWLHANVGATPAVSRVPPEALERRQNASGG